MKYQIKRGNTVIASVALEGSQIRKALGEDLIDVTFKSKTAIDIQVEDTVEVYGRVYKLNRPVEPTQADGIFYYDAQFEALWYDLIDVQFRGLGATNELTEAEFSIYATAYDIVDLAVRNANRVMNGWTIGVVDETDRYNFTFNGQNVRQALNQLVEVFQSEIWFDNKTIHFQKREIQSGLSLSYGKGNGLYEFTRANRTDANVVTRLYVEGGSRNLPTGYGRTKLRLPNNQPYIQDAGVTKIKEHTITFDNIYPERVGTVTGIVNALTFVDTSMNFDINDHLSGQKAKIGFQTGKLAGIEFELNSYDHATKRFRLVLNTTDKAWPDGLPNDTLKPEIGDQYIIFDINLPQEYIDNAEARLLAAGQEYYDKYKFDQYQFTVMLTPIWVKEQNPNIDLGHTLNLTNVALDIDKNTRIAGYTRDLQNEYAYELELSDELTIAEVVRQFAQQERILYAIQTAGLLDPEQMRRNLFLNRLSENDGYLFLGADKVKAGFADHADTSDLASHAFTADLATHALTADYAYDADKWDGRQFADYLAQPVRPTDNVVFAKVTTEGGIVSPSFASGFSGHGYRLAKDGNGDYLLEVDRMLVRKDFSVYELIVNQIRATNGSLWVSDSIKITGATVSGSNFVCSIDTDGGTIYTPFAINDIVRCQRFNGQSMKYYTARVTAVTSSTFTITKLEGASNPASGDELVRIGNTTNANRQGALYLTASDSGAPFLDVVDGVNSASLANKTKVRLGKLDGIVDPDFGALSGYGLFAQNGFFKGRLQVLTGSNVYTKTEANGHVNTAKTEAINAASSDATTKANNARTQAVSTANQFTSDAVNAIAIGGRNMLTLSLFNDGKTGSAASYGYLVNGGTLTKPATYLRITLNSNQGLIYKNIPNSAVGETYTITAHVRTNTASSGTGRFQVVIGNTSGSVLHSSAQIHGDWQTVSVTGILTAGSLRAYFRMIGGASGDLFDLRWVKCEIGNKATDWTPAPEDITNAIEVVRTETITQFNVLESEINSKVSQSSFNTLNQRVGTAESTITQQAGQIASKVSQTDFNVLNNTVSGINGRVTTAESTITQQAGQIASKVSQTDFNVLNNTVSGINGRVTTAESTITQQAGQIALRATKTEMTTSVNDAIFTAASDATTKSNAARAAAVGDAKTYTDSQITIANNAISLKANQTDVTSLNTRVSTAEAQITPNAINLTVSSQINSTVNNAVNAIVIGGRNMLTMSLFNDGKTGSAGSYGYLVSGGTLTKPATYLRITLNSGQALIYKNVPNSAVGETYTITARVRTNAPSGTGRFQVVIGNTSGSSLHSSAQIHGDWQTVSVTGVLTTGSLRAYFRMIGGASGDLFDLQWVKCEIGNKATDWTPAPEDVNSDIALRPTESQIQSGIQINANAITVFGQNISMAGKVTFASLDSGAQGQITGAQGTANTALSNANTANNNLTALQGSLGSLAYDSQVQLAKLGNTIIEGGYLKADLINVNALFAQSITATNLNVTGNSQIAGFYVSGSMIQSINETNVNGLNISPMGIQYRDRRHSQSLAPTAIVGIGALESSTAMMSINVSVSHPIKSGLEIDVPNGTAFSIGLGGVSVYDGSTWRNGGTQNITIGGVTMRFVKGWFCGII